MSKLPTRRVPSDDFTVVLQDKTYRPHAGEWVEFRGFPTVGAQLRFMRAASWRAKTPDDFAAMGPDELEEAMASMTEAIESTISELAQAIVAWTWTDNEGRPYPSPPSESDLQRLSTEEIGYLSAAYRGNAGDDSKNPSSRSTSPSRAKGKRRKSG